MCQSRSGSFGDLPGGQNRDRTGGFDGKPNCLPKRIRGSVRATKRFFEHLAG